MLDAKKKWGLKPPRTGDEGICGHLEPEVVVRKSRKVVLEIRKAHGQPRMREQAAGGAPSSLWFSSPHPPLPLPAPSSFYCRVKGNIETSPSVERKSLVQDEAAKLKKQKGALLRKSSSAEIRSLTHLLSLLRVRASSPF